MNLFKPPLKSNSFDLVICNGVLHHTKNPYLGFKTIAKLVKKDGYILIGLYNKYGRLTTDMRRNIFNFTGSTFKFLDPRLRDKKVGSLKKNIWFMDQYKNPHESKHTIDEVLQWFKETGFEFVNSIPEISPQGEYKHDQLFNKHSEGHYMDRLFSQLHLMLSGGSEGGFFVMIGRKKC
jgi:SAM-dependent methyltransferase